MPLRAGRSWGRATAEVDSGSEAGEDASGAVGRSGDKAKLGLSFQVTEDEDEEMVRELERVRRAAFDACLAEVVRHLEQFLARRPQASFEEWISDLHPDNLQADPLTGEACIDQRFYSREGEHRKLWNARMPIVRQVQARSPDCSPATSSLGSGSGARTPVLCRPTLSATPGPPYVELLVPTSSQFSTLGSSVLVPAMRSAGETAAPGEQLKASTASTAGTPPAHLPVPSQIQWLAPVPVAVVAPPAWYEWAALPAPGPLLQQQVLVQMHFAAAATTASQQAAPQQFHCGTTPLRGGRQSTTVAPPPQVLRWQSPPRQAYSPAPPPTRSTLGATARTSVSPMRTTTNLSTRTDSPLRTAPLPSRAESPLRTSGLPSRMESPLRLGIPRRGSSAIVHPARGALGGSFVWPKQHSRTGAATAAAGGA